MRSREERRGGAGGKREQKRKVKGEGKEGGVSDQDLYATVEGLMEGRGGEGGREFETKREKYVLLMKRQRNADSHTQAPHLHTGICKEILYILDTFFYPSIHTPIPPSHISTHMHTGPRELK